VRFRRVTVTGSYDPDGEVRLVPRVHGGQPGAHLLTPLIRADGDPVLIDRGWVPRGQAAPAPEGTVTVTGVIKPPERPGWVTPDNDPARGDWFWVDLARIGAARGLALAPVVVAAEGDVPAGTLPVPSPPTPNLPNNHLQYVVTWYGLALALAAVGIAYGRRRRVGSET
jgi:surfeit locus 1 family protein